jgi:integrase
MSRKRTGTVYKRPLSRGGFTYYGKVTETKNGISKRRSVNLGTACKATAEAKLRQLNEAASGSGSDAGTVGFAMAKAAKQAEKTMRSWRDMESRLRHHAYPMLGHCQICEVTSEDIQNTLDAAVESGQSRQSVVHLRNALKRVFKPYIRRGLVDKDLVTLTEVPEEAATDGRERVLIDDDTFVTLVTWLDQQPIDQTVGGMPCGELLTMCVVSRCIGGMRTSDMHAWRWDDINTVDWTVAQVPRPKTDQNTRVTQRVRVVHRLTDNETPFLRAWWRYLGQPARGPVFPVRRGPRAGMHKRHSTYPKPLRQALRCALGIDEYQLETRTVSRVYNRGTVREQFRPLEISKTVYREVRPPSGYERALLFDNETTRATDVHCFRHAFCTGIADAGASLQEQMLAAGHSNPRTAMGYVHLNQRKVVDTTGQVPNLRGSQQAANPRNSAAPTESIVHDGRRLSIRRGTNEKRSAVTTDRPHSSFSDSLSGADGTRTRGLRRDRPAL